VNRGEKEEVVADLSRTFNNAAAVVVTHYRGLNVAEISDLRGKMREAGAKFRVTKNRLARLALDGTPYAPLAEMFEGPVAIAYSDDVVAPAKICVNFAKQNDKLVVVGGAMGETLLDASAVNDLASLPSLDELRGKIIGLLNAPATKVAGVLQAPAGQLARVIDAHVKSSEAT
jgi:large subunit ribosomal protein L10